MSLRVRSAASGARGSPSRSTGPSRPQNSWRWVGGSGRQHTLLMEIQLTKVYCILRSHLKTQKAFFLTSFSLFRSVFSTRRTQWCRPLLQDQMQMDRALGSSLFPARCLSSRNLKCEIVWLPLKSTSSCTCTRVRACRAEPTPTW